MKTNDATITSYKICSKCKEKKLLSEFYKLSKGKQGRAYWCKACEDAKNQKWARENPERAKEISDRNYRENLEKVRKQHSTYYHRNRDVRRRKLKENAIKRYGLTIEQYETMIETQNNKCTICGQEECIKAPGIYNEVKSLAIDHCHITGVVRGLLCSNCNKGLGSFKDNPEFLKRAALYLEKFQKENSNIIVSDQDDCLAQFSALAVSLANKLKGTNYTQNDLLTWDLPKEVYETYKEYETTGFYSHLEFFPDAAEVMFELKKRLNAKLVILTARPEQFQAETKLHLLVNKFPYDEIIFSKDKAAEIERLSQTNTIKLFLDDRLENVESVLATGKVEKMFIKDMKHNQIYNELPGVTRIKQLTDLLTHFEAKNAK